MVDIRTSSRQPTMHLRKRNPQQRQPTCRDTNCTTSIPPAWLVRMLHPGNQSGLHQAKARMPNCLPVIWPSRSRSRKRDPCSFCIYKRNCSARLIKHYEAINKQIRAFSLAGCQGRVNVLPSWIQTKCMHSQLAYAKVLGRQPLCQEDPNTCHAHVYISCYRSLPSVGILALKLEPQLHLADLSVQ